jgi:hypothetical protein
MSVVVSEGLLLSHILVYNMYQNTASTKARRCKQVLNQLQSCPIRKLFPYDQS